MYHKGIYRRGKAKKSAEKEKTEYAKTTTFVAGIQKGKAAYYQVSAYPSDQTNYAVHLFYCIVGWSLVDYFQV